MCKQKSNLNTMSLCDPENFLLLFWSQTEVHIQYLLWPAFLTILSAVSMTPKSPLTNSTSFDSSVVVVYICEQEQRTYTIAEIYKRAVFWPYILTNDP